MCVCTFFIAASHWIFFMLVSGLGLSLQQYEIGDTSSVACKPTSGHMYIFYIKLNDA